MSSLIAGRRILLAVNTHSRRGHQPLDPALAVFARAGLSVQVEKGRRSSKIPPLIRRFRESVDCVVLAGGDGTLNAALSDLLEAELPVGILPMGTANDLAASLGIPEDLALAAEIIAAGHTRRIDVGDVNGRPFLNVASIGLSVALTKELGHGLKRRWGRLAYMLAGIKALPSLRPFKAEIKFKDAHVKVRTVQIGVGNGRRYGGRAIVAQDAEVDDGWLDLYSIETDSLLRLLMLYPDFLHGRQGTWDVVRTQRGQWFEITTRRPKRIVADGKKVAHTPARFTIRPGALNVFAPPRPSSEAQSQMAE